MQAIILIMKVSWYLIEYCSKWSPCQNVQIHPHVFQSWREFASACVEIFQEPSLLKSRRQSRMVKWKTGICLHYYTCVLLPCTYLEGRDHIHEKRTWSRGKAKSWASLLRRRSPGSCWSRRSTPVCPDGSGLSRCKRDWHHSQPLNHTWAEREKELAKRRKTRLISLCSKTTYWAERETNCFVIKFTPKHERIWWRGRFLDGWELCSAHPQSLRLLFRSHEALPSSCPAKSLVFPRLCQTSFVRSRARTSKQRNKKKMGTICATRDLPK